MWHNYQDGNLNQKGKDNEFEWISHKSWKIHFEVIPTLASVLPTYKKKSVVQLDPKMWESLCITKTFFSIPPVISRPLSGETLFLDLVIFAKAVSIIIVREVGNT